MSKMKKIEKSDSKNVMLDSKQSENLRMRSKSIAHGVYTDARQSEMMPSDMHDE